MVYYNFKIYIDYIIFKIYVIGIILNINKINLNFKLIFIKYYNYFNFIFYFRVVLLLINIKIGNINNI